MRWITTNDTLADSLAKESNMVVVGKKERFEDWIIIESFKYLPQDEVTGYMINLAWNELRNLPSTQTRIKKYNLGTKLSTSEEENYIPTMLSIDGAGAGEETVLFFTG